MTRLYICEKPSLANALAENLGVKEKKNGYYVIEDGYVAALRGHIMKLYDAADYDEKYKTWSLQTLPIIPTKFKKIVKTTSNYKSIHQTISSLLKKSDEVVNVGDPDREGQLLVDEVLDSLSCKLPTKRLFINAMDDTTIKRALVSIEDNNSEKNRNIYQAALGREQTDWLIGINATRKFSIDSHKKIPVGRVKTAVLALVARRNDEIDNFISKTHYQVKAAFRTEKSVPFVTTWKPKDDLLDKDNHLLDITEARKCEQKVSRQRGRVTKLETKPHKENPPLPFSLSTLQRAAGPELNFSPSKTLELAQVLYEKKLTTYPRSDCNYLPDSQYSDAVTIIDNLKLTGDDSLKKMAYAANSSLKSSAYNTSKVEAHHAIIPTMEKIDLNELKDDEKALYLMIATRFLLQFYPVHTYDETIIGIICEDEYFEAKGRIVTNQGWKDAIKQFKEEANDNKKDNSVSIPNVKLDDSLIVSSINISTLETEPPKRFTQDTLIGAMTSAHNYVQDKKLKEIVKNIKGIGTEATRSNILEALIKNGQLIEKSTGKKKKELYISDSDKELLSFLPDSIKYPDMTALMELDLDKIAKGEMSLNDFMQKQIEYVNELIKVESNFSQATTTPNANNPICPYCKTGKLFQRNGSNGKFWGCSNWKTGCKVTFPDENNKPLIHECPICKEGYLRRIKNQNLNNYFWNCSNYQNGCKVAFSDNKGRPVVKLCPSCKKSYLKKWPGKDGKPDYYSCSSCHKFYSITKSGLPDTSIKKEK